ncbi:hypothetical protein FG386_000791 [Cryptosporidium ryanae]|uniref:uncharacterized protein n=1 Tax=Cryptosporidium ryanae TaxID=515981 RepID=UPI003519ED9B|nr:hypothetical protein FG386_000791 [Cryptosporidium ryanae]
MGNTPAYDVDTKDILNKKGSNFIQPLTKSFSDFDLTSSVTSKVASLQGIPNQFIEDPVSDTLAKISSRIVTTCGVIHYLSKAGSNENVYSEFEVLDNISDKNYIFESLDSKEEKSVCENYSSKIKNNDLIPTTKNNLFDVITYGMRFELESRESSENLESIIENKSTNNDSNNIVEVLVENKPKIREIEVKSKLFKIFGNKRNHMPFLSPGIIDVFLPFILDETLISCFLVCPHWLLTIANFLNKKYGSSIDKKFIECYSDNIELEHATVTIQPVLTVGGSVRVDRVLYAKVLKGCLNKSSTLSYNFKYKSALMEEMNNISRKNRSNSIFQPISKKNSGIFSLMGAIYTSSYKFDTRAMGTKRIQWAYKDISRSHCEEVAVAHTTTKSSLNVGDRIEIAINMSNSFGIVDLDSIKFQKLIFEEITSEKCEIEDMYSSESDWRPVNSQNKELRDLFNVPIFSPQMELLYTEYAGTDIITYKITYKATKPGELNNSKEHFGIDISVVPSNFAIISALKRKGLQHDRYSPLQLRVGDQLVLYISKGGTIPT